MPVHFVRGGLELHFHTAQDALSLQRDTLQKATTRQDQKKLKALEFKTKTASRIHFGELDDPAHMVAGREISQPEAPKTRWGKFKKFFTDKRSIFLTLNKVGADGKQENVNIVVNRNSFKTRMFLPGEKKQIEEFDKLSDALQAAQKKLANAEEKQDAAEIEKAKKACERASNELMYRMEAIVKKRMQEKITPPQEGKASGLKAKATPSTGKSAAELAAARAIGTPGDEWKMFAGIKEKMVPSLQQLDFALKDLVRVAKETYEKKGASPFSSCFSDIDWKALERFKTRDLSEYYDVRGLEVGPKGIFDLIVEGLKAGDMMDVEGNIKNHALAEAYDAAAKAENAAMDVELELHGKPPAPLDNAAELEQGVKDLIETIKPYLKPVSSEKQEQTQASLALEKGRRESTSTFIQKRLETFFNEGTDPNKNWYSQMDGLFRDIHHVLVHSGLAKALPGGAIEFKNQGSDIARVYLPLANKYREAIDERLKETRKADQTAKPAGKKPVHSKQTEAVPTKAKEKSEPSYTKRVQMAFVDERKKFEGKLQETLKATGKALQELATVADKEGKLKASLSQEDSKKLTEGKLSFSGAISSEDLDEIWGVLERGLVASGQLKKNKQGGLVPDAKASSEVVRAFNEARQAMAADIKAAEEFGIIETWEQGEKILRQPLTIMVRYLADIDPNVLSEFINAEFSKKRFEGHEGDITYMFARTTHNNRPRDPSELAQMVPKLVEEMNKSSKVLKALNAKEADALQFALEELTTAGKKIDQLVKSRQEDL